LDSNYSETGHFLDATGERSVHSRHPILYITFSVMLC